MSVIISSVNKYVPKIEKIKNTFGIKELRTELTSKDILKKYGFSETVPPDYEEIKSRVFENLSNNEDVNSRELKFVTKEIFQNETKDELKKKIFKTIIDKNEPRLIRNLFYFYLLHFDEEEELISKISKYIKKNLEILTRRWRKRLNYIDFLDVKNVISNISKKIYEEKKIEPVLIKSGLSGAFTSSKLLVSTFYRMAEEARDHKSDEKAFQFAQIVSENNKIKESLGSQAMIGLLGRFSDNKNQIRNDQLKIMVKGLFLESYGDPRLTYTKWPSLTISYGGDRKRVRYIEVVKNWIMLENIEVFFQIMRETAIEHQFAEREKLWKKIFKKGAISEACLILGWSVSHVARELTENNEDLRYLSWSNLENAGHDQSVLLMKIRGETNITVAEWSHNGAFRLWADSEKAPKLYQKEYKGLPQLQKDKHELMHNSDQKQAHIGSRWVYKIQKMIEQYTNVDI